MIFRDCPIGFHQLWTATNEVHGGRKGGLLSNHLRLIPPRSVEKMREVRREKKEPPKSSWNRVLLIILDFFPRGGTKEIGERKKNRKKQKNFLSQVYGVGGPGEEWEERGRFWSLTLTFTCFLEWPGGRKKRENPYRSITVRARAVREHGREKGKEKRKA